MRSAERCKEHYQGDRCCEARGHASSLALKPDPQHAGNFNVWVGEGDSKKLLKGTAMRWHRADFRKADRFYRQLSRFNFAPSSRANAAGMAGLRQVVRDQLGKLAQMFQRPANKG